MKVFLIILLCGVIGAVIFIVIWLITRKYELKERKRREEQEKIREAEKQKEIDIQIKRQNEEQRLRQEEERKHWQEYAEWLNENGMTDIRVYGTFMYDPNSAKWCKRGERVIFDADSTTKATINKVNGTKYRAASHTVFVETKNIDCPCVVFECGSSAETAEKIKATVNIISKQNRGKINTKIVM